MTGLELHWMGDRPAGTKEVEIKRVHFGDFHAEQSWWLFPIARNTPSACSSGRDFLRKLQLISGFALISLFFSASRLWLWYNFFFCFSIFFYASFYTINHWRLLYLKICYLEREKASSLSPWEDSWTLSYLYIDSACFLHLLSLWFLCPWLSNPLA